MNQFMNNPAINPQGIQFQNQRNFAVGNSFNNIVWVQGIEGAKAFQLPANSRAQLMDSENEGVFYIKTSDDIGMCSLRSFEYTEKENSPVASNAKLDLSEYVRKDELQELLKGVIGREQSVSAAKSKSGKNVISE